MRQKTPPAWACPLRFIDLETTGLDPAAHEITEIAILDAGGAVLLHRRIRVERMEDADPEALEMNGYDAELWAETARSWGEVAPLVAAHLRHAIILGWNVAAFDAPFLDHAKGLDRDELRYRVVDVMALAFEQLVRHKLTRGLSLKRTCSYLGISNQGAHRADVDARRAWAVYFQLAGAGWLRRLKWRFFAFLRGHDDNGK